MSTSSSLFKSSWSKSNAQAPISILSNSLPVLNLTLTGDSRMNIKFDYTINKEAKNMDHDIPDITYMLDEGRYVQSNVLNMNKH